MNGEEEEKNELREEGSHRSLQVQTWLPFLLEINDFHLKWYVLNIKVRITNLRGTPSP